MVAIINGASPNINLEIRVFDAAGDQVGDALIYADDDAIDASGTIALERALNAGQPEVLFDDLAVYEAV